MSTLLYLASGNYRPIYEDLDFDQIILVDRNMKLHLPQPADSKVELIRGDALPAIKRLKERKGLKINCLVSVNEGLYEGGGDYPIFSDFLLGYLSPLLADDLVVITDLNYYRAAQIAGKVGKMDWGYSKQKIHQNHPSYIDPRKFAYKGESLKEGYGDVFLLNKINKRYSLPLNPNLSIAIIHGSIWEDEQLLDSMGCNLRKREGMHTRHPINEFFLDPPYVFNIHGKSIEEILAHAEANQVAHLGLMPWMNGDYAHVIEVLRNYKSQYLKKISFYHLRRGNYSMMYGLIPNLNQ
jgi:hypothetical protein